MTKKKEKPAKKAEDPPESPPVEPSPNPEPAHHNPPPATVSKQSGNSEIETPKSKTTSVTRKPRRTSSRPKKEKVWWGFGYHDKDG